MSIDLVKALKAPFSTEGWGVKTLIGGVLLCIPIVNFVVIGYWMKYLRNVLDNENQLPDYSDFGGLFVTGLKAFVGSIILAVPVMILIAIVSMVFAKAEFLSALLTSLMYFVYYYVAYIMCARFSLDEKILSMIDIKAALLILKDNKNLVSFVILFIVLGIIYGLVTALSAITVVGIILIPFIIQASILSTMNLTGQFVSSAPNFEQVKTSLK